MIPAAQLRPAVEHLAADGFVAYPTETVWGLGACADRPIAIERLMKWKGRGDDAPMSLLVPSIEAAANLGCVLEGGALRLAESFWPGPLTLIVATRERFARGVAGPSGALGLRCSPHPMASALARAVDAAGLGPLTSTSLNRTGNPPAAHREQAEALVTNRGSGERNESEPFLFADPDGREAFDAGGDRPSTVVDCTQETPRLVRDGAIDFDQIEAIWSGVARI
jgi:L-threonylcarbamoyladenylate synthase